LIYPDNFEHKIGFDQIRSMLAERCHSDMGRQRVEGMGFCTDPGLIKRMVGETAEFRKIIESGQPFPGNDYYNLVPVLRRIRTPGSWILPEELLELRLSLKTLADCLAFFQKPAARQFIHLIALTGDLEIPVVLLNETERIMDEKGVIRDKASPELAGIRKDISGKTKASEKLIGQLLNQARQSGWTTPDAGVTLNDGRLVLPLQATHKRRIRGIIHDESASGQTVYLEPEACLEINNEIRELEGAERREIIRILTHFSDMIRPEIDELMKGYAFLGQIDFIRSKARLAIDTESQEPVIADERVIRWTNVRHPLLKIALQAKRKTIVPLNIKLDGTDRILVITGPNAGGKSVCLKTVGLLQYMLQCGLLLPMDPESQICVFKNLFIDIGDEQSLENDLSTYSSHLMNLQFFMEHGNEATLFLIDELGAGTDPALGGAIAEAVLEKLADTGAYGVVTTHYSNLKLMEGNIPGIVNGAMLFDTKRMQPLYQLATGKPGSSFTFEIARRIGFNETVIQAAMEKSGKTHIDFERQLQELESEKLTLQKRLKEFQVADSFLTEMIEKYETMKADLERSRKAILEEARQQAMEILEQSNRVVEKTIKEIRESQAEKEKTKAARARITDLGREISESSRPGKEWDEKSEKPGKESIQSFKPGDWVSLQGQKVPGRIQRIKGGKAVADFAGIRISVPVRKLIASEPPAENITGHHTRMIRDLNEKAVNFKLALDIRGKSAEEALMSVQKYLDDAYLLRIKEVKILHGKGEGILRRVIRDLLTSLEEVESFEDEHIERGGAGITRVTIR
jgi:DNA mismatch repair protein MutS2